jgi:hypothetical protein
VALRIASKDMARIREERVLLDGIEGSVCERNLPQPQSGHLRHTPSIKSAIRPAVPIGGPTDGFA